MIELKQMFEEAYTTALVLYRKPFTCMTFLCWANATPKINTNASFQQKTNHCLSVPE